MSFHSYLKNIESKTEKTPEDLADLALQKGFMENGFLKRAIKAGEVVQWLKDDFQLGHGYAMAMYAYLKGKRE